MQEATFYAIDKRDGAVVQSCVMPEGMRKMFFAMHPELEELI